MKTKLTFAIILSLGIGSTAFAQTGRVGVNTTAPKSTFDVVGKPADGTAVDGIIAPRLTGDQLHAKNTVYTAAQTGAIVYVTAADSAPGGQTVNVTAPGYYYYDGAVGVQKWIRVVTPVGDDTNDAWINGTAKVLLGTKSDGTARTAGTDFVALDNGNVGIGLPAPTTKLEITSTGTNNPLKLNNLQTGANTDKLLTVDGNGNVRQVTPADGVVGLFIQSGNVQGTSQVDIPAGSISDIPGAEFTISPTVNVRLIISTSALPLPTNPFSPVQGSINLNQKNGALPFTVIASQYYSATDAPLPTNSIPFVKLGNYSTITRVVDLAPGTYTFKLTAKSWYNTTTFNINPFPQYGGSTVDDANAMKASVTYQVYTK